MLLHPLLLSSVSGMSGLVQCCALLGSTGVLGAQACLQGHLGPTQLTHMHGCGAGQIALELILGFDQSLLTEATVDRCTAAFVDWNDGLFSFPVDLPGTGAQR